MAKENKKMDMNQLGKKLVEISTARLESKIDAANSTKKAKKAAPKK
jgi:hypothetical protein